MTSLPSLYSLLLIPNVDSVNFMQIRGVCLTVNEPRTDHDHCGLFLVDSIDFLGWIIRYHERGKVIMFMTRLASIDHKLVSHLGSLNQYTA
jgi:hypothetical protein